MGLASTPDLASYGFGYRWAKQAFVPRSSAKGAYSSIATGNTTLGSDNNEIAYGKFAIKGSNGYRQYPAYLNGEDSTINGGSEMYNLEISNSQTGSFKSLSQALNTDLSSSTGAIQQSLFNLYTLQSPSVDSDTISNSLTLSNFLNYNSPQSFPSGEQGLDAFSKAINSITDTGQPCSPLVLPPQIYQCYEFYYEGQPNELSFSNNINSEVTYSSADNSLRIGSGNVTTNTQALADGESLDVTFQFFGTDAPGTGDDFSFDSTFTNSVTSSKTQGTTNLSSRQQSDGGSNTQGGSTGGNISVSVSATESASANLVFGSEGFSSTQKVGYQNSWSNTWNNVKTFNATSENSLSTNNSISKSSEITDTFSFSANINLSGITATGKTANGTPIYDYETPITDPSTGETKVVQYQIVEGAWYKWELSYYKGSVQNLVEGNYSMSGQVGSLDDSSNNANGGNVAQAYYLAQAGQGFGYANADQSIIESYNTSRDGTNQTTAVQFEDITDPSDLRSVNINGSTTAGTAVNNNLSLQLVAISTTSGNTSSSNANSSLGSAMLRRSSNTKNQKISINEGLALQPHETQNPTGYNGSKGAEFVSDTLGQDFIRTEGGNDRVRIKGNTVQSSNGGDIVYLGKGKDKLKAGKAQGFNSVFAGPGRDHIADGKGHLGADLGPGNDTFVHGGGTDYVTLGKGRDTLKIKANATGKNHTLVVHDFHVGDDHITGVRNDANLQWDSTIHGFRMQGHGDSTIRLHTHGQDEVLEPEFWVGLGLQNMNALKLHKRPHKSLRWEHIRKQYGRYGFSKPNVRYQDWETFSASAERLHQTVSTLAAIEGKSNLSSSQLEKASGFAENVDSFHAYIAGVHNILNL
jgi:hypothetical protein